MSRRSHPGMQAATALETALEELERLRMENVELRAANARLRRALEGRLSGGDHTMTVKALPVCDARRGKTVFIHRSRLRAIGKSRRRRERQARIAAAEARYAALPAEELARVARLRGGRP